HRHFQVRVQVDLPVVGAGAHLVAQALLGRVDGLDHRVELAGRVERVAAGDVAGVAQVAGTGVDQEAADFVGGQAVAVGVMEYRAVLVERDDVAVGQVVGVLAGCLAVGQVDPELAGTGTERTFGGTVRAHTVRGGL